MTIHVLPPPDRGLPRHNRAFDLVGEGEVMRRERLLAFLGIRDWFFERFRYDQHRPDPSVRFGPPEIPRENDHPRGSVRWRDFFIWLATMSPAEYAALRYWMRMDAADRERGTPTLGKVGVLNIVVDMGTTG